MMNKKRKTDFDKLCEYLEWLDVHSKQTSSRSSVPDGRIAVLYSVNRMRYTHAVYILNTHYKEAYIYTPDYGFLFSAKNVDTCYHYLLELSKSKDNKISRCI